MLDGFEPINKLRAKICYKIFYCIPLHYHVKDVSAKDGQKLLTLNDITYVFIQQMSRTIRWNVSKLSSTSVSNSLCSQGRKFFPSVLARAPNLVGVVINLIVLGNGGFWAHDPTSQTGRPLHCIYTRIQCIFIFSDRQIYCPGRDIKYLAYFASLVNRISNTAASHEYISSFSYSEIAVSITAAGTEKKEVSSKIIIIMILAVRALLVDGRQKKAFPTAFDCAKRRWKIPPRGRRSIEGKSGGMRRSFCF